MNDYKRFGLLICCSDNGVMNVESVKRLIDVMEKMEYNLLELSIDDTYKIDDEPYFGYLRGGYTKAEIREIDEYAKEHGIELVPCIQTLAHLTNLVKLPHYSDIVDISNILLIDEPKTYTLIEKMFQSLQQSFSSRLVNIGFDEAHLVGLGKYLDKHGYVNRYELLLRHLNKVVEIAEKYGFKVHMWSDMFFRLATGGNYYDLGVRIPKKVREKVPETVSLCYWDYGEHELKEEIFDDMFKAHEDFNREIWYAGGAWCWNGFAPNNNFSLKAMSLAMKQVIKHSVENVFITLWGNDGNDCSWFSTLPALYAIRQFSKGVFDMEQIKAGFKELLGYNFDDFMILDIPNKTSKNPECLKIENPCKSLLFNDCFVGWKDHALTQVDFIPYGEYAKAIENAGKDVGEYKYLFDSLSALCSVLEKKAYLGINTRKAYKENDKEKLKELICDYEECANRLTVYHEMFRRQWLKEFKPYGFEVHTIRLGGLRARIIECKRRIEEYLSGEKTSIPELEEEILPYANWGLQYNSYRGLVTVAQI